MTKVVLLDTGPLGLVSHPNAATKNEQAAQWLRGLLAADVTVLVPEIADYELRRELLRAGKAKSVAVLDRYKASLGYIPLTTEAMIQAAQFWATARQEGKPTAPDLALDGDVILAAQAEVIRSGGDDVVVATTNEGHLSRFVPASLAECRRHLASEDRGRFSAAPPTRIVSKPLQPLRIRVFGLTPV